jgi:hypothetical protein
MTRDELRSAYLAILEDLGADWTRAFELQSDCEVVGTGRDDEHPTFKHGHTVVYRTEVDSGEQIHVLKQLPTRSGRVAAFLFQRDNDGKFAFIGDALVDGPAVGLPQNN